MLRTRIKDARVGMKLALPVLHPTAPGRVLLRAGYALESRSLSRLRDLGVRAVWVAYPPLSFLLRYTSPEIVRQQARLVGQVGRLFDAARREVQAEIEYDRYAQAVGALAEALTMTPSAAVFLDRLAEAPDTELEHASNVSYLCTLMGLKLATYLEQQRSRLTPSRARDVIPLGVAGMLHDIGMTRLTAEQLEAVRRAPNPADAVFRSHVELGYDLVKGRVPATVASAVLSHHERYDGSGFPGRVFADGRTERVEGQSIHVYARIVAVADEFDRRLQTPDGEGVPRVRVLASMIHEPDAAGFDPMAVKALLAVCPPYPPGTMVTLSNGVRGVVIGWAMADPCRPRVQPFDPAEPEPDTPPAVIDLSQTSGVCVAEAEGVDVGRDNFYPDTPAMLCLDSANRRLHNAAEVLRRQAAAQGDAPWSEAG
ncbi:MAG: HD domain-containing phosphohydrolase [Planctomycetota bacterium]